MRPLTAILVGLIFGLVITMSHKTNGDPPHGVKDLASDPIRTEAGPSESQLLEIQKIRSQLGGGVLKGTLLDDGTTSGIFESKIRSAMGLPPAPKQPADTNDVMVRKLRMHCARLDRIANAIEELREYRNADALRESAGELRQIARQLDAVPLSEKRTAGSDSDEADDSHG